MISGFFAKTVEDTMGGFNFENNMKNTMEALNKKVGGHSLNLQACMPVIINKGTREGTRKATYKMQ